MQRKSGSYKSSTRKTKQCKRKGSAHNKGQLRALKTSSNSSTSKEATTTKKRATTRSRSTQSAKSLAASCKSTVMKSGSTTEIIVDEYLTHVQLSKSRKAKYYRKGQKIPQKYSKFKSYNHKGYLIGADGEPIIANPGVVNTPRMLKINGQQLYSGNMNPMVRSKVVNVLKEFMSNCIPDGLELGFPVRVESDLYAPLAAKNWDLDNQWIYHKCFLDALVAKGCLPDDNIMFVTQAPAFRYFPCDHKEDRKIVYRIIPEDRPEILEHGAYIAYHSSETDEGEPLEF